MRHSRKKDKHFSFSHQYYLTFHGGDLSRMLNLCKGHEIQLENIRKDDCLHAKMDKNNWNKLQPYLEKCQVHAKIEAETGFFVLLKKHKWIPICFAIFVCFCSILYYLSLFVWNISITGDSVYTKEEVMTYISENMVPIGTKKKELDFDQMEKNLREHYDQIAWISCKCEGTALKVDFVETIPKKVSQSSNQPCNLVASKDALITDILAQNGQKLASVGDEVKKGDILITGVVNIYNEYEELIETNCVPASGFVYGQTKIKYYKEIPMEYVAKDSKDQKKSYTLQIGSNKWNLLKPKHSSKYSQYAQTYQCKIGNCYYLPVYFTIHHYQSPKVTTKRYEDEEIKKKQQNILDLYIENLQKKGVEILENNVTIDVKESACIASGNLVVRENIAVPKAIDVIEEKEEK
ncbi:MAG: sporulation protein YqfD [Wujia sp.]